MLGPIQGTRGPAVKKNMKTLVCFLAALFLRPAQPHPEPAHLPEPHTEQAVALCFVSDTQGPEARVELSPTLGPISR